MDEWKFIVNEWDEWSWNERLKKNEYMNKYVADMATYNANMNVINYMYINVARKDDWNEVKCAWQWISHDGMNWKWITNESTPSWVSIHDMCDLWMYAYACQY